MLWKQLVILIWFGVKNGSIPRELSWICPAGHLMCAHRPSPRLRWSGMTGRFKTAKLSQKLELRLLTSQRGLNVAPFNLPRWRGHRWKSIPRLGRNCFIHLKKKHQHTITFSNATCLLCLCHFRCWIRWVVNDDTRGFMFDDCHVSFALAS